MGQVLPPGAARPELAATRRLDYELEVGVFVGRGNELGRAYRWRRPRRMSLDCAC